METFGLCLVTFFSACVFTYFNVSNSKKLSNYFFLIYSSAIIIIYCIVYGLIGVFLFLLLKESAFVISENSTNLAGSYLTAFLIGFATKGVTDIKFVEIKHGSEPFPIGLKTFSYAIDSHFDKELNSICFDRFLDFIAPYKKKYENTNLTLFKKQVHKILLSHPVPEKVDEFSASVMAKATSTKEILEKILKEFGKRTLDTINKNVNPDL